ncbi:MAG: hypothetical protein ABI035_09525, partial [Gemmatimonadaceae bacterium]
MHEQTAATRWLTYRFSVFACLLLSVMAPNCFATVRVSSSLSAVVVQGLTCDLGVDPLGVDDPAPQLHWTLVAARRQDRGVVQRAFEILVASSRAKLERNQGDFWDSGRRTSELAPSVMYDGNPLASDTMYYWKVRVWTAQEQSGWSGTATFLTGMLHPSDWKARWIAAATDSPGDVQAGTSDGPVVASVLPLPIFRDTFEMTKR